MAVAPDGIVEHDVRTVLAVVHAVVSELLAIGIDAVRIRGEDVIEFLGHWEEVLEVARVLDGLEEGGLAVLPCVVEQLLERGARSLTELDSSPLLIRNSLPAGHVEQEVESGLNDAVNLRRADVRDLLEGVTIEVQHVLVGDDRDVERELGREVLGPVALRERGGELDQELS